MTWPPIDSTDAREQREAQAEQEATEHEQQQAHSLACSRGWLGEDSDGRPIPCLRCRPWLAHVDCRLCGTTWQACGAQTAGGRGRCCTNCDHHQHARGDHTA